MSPLARRLRRFFFVASPTSVVKHRVYKTRDNPVEGDLAACGVAVRTGWRWIYYSHKDATRLRKCKRCEHAAG